MQGSLRGNASSVMKIILEDGPFSYQVDWAKEPLVGEDGIPAVGDCIESFPL